MHPELFELPFIHITVKSYGLMMVIGFLTAIFIIRRLSRDITPDPQMITNAALYSLIAGVVGSRIFYVVHHYQEFQGRAFSVFAIWKGGLELLGGVILAITVILLYLRYHKLPIRKYLDILAIGLMSALVFGRIGCFMNGCCFGRPTDLPWGVRFPYGAPAYRSQTSPNELRDRSEPQLQLPPGYYDEYDYLKPFEQLTEQQKQQVSLRGDGAYRCLPVHPTQLYASVNAAIGCLLLYLFWRRAQKAQKENKRGFLTQSGCIFALMFLYYGITRFVLEFIRDDNPFEYAWWIVYEGKTVSQNIGIYMMVFAIVLIFIFQRMRPYKPAKERG
jgi:phosphatidylglycerol:prolipoprotein diacylglycerol transferase